MRQSLLLKDRLVLKTLEGLQNYLSCKVRFSKDEKRAWIGQPNLIENLNKKFCNQVKKVQSYKTPGIPKFLIVRPMVDHEKISADKKIQLGVGMLVFLKKHSRPNIANATRELLKVNDNSNSAAFSELL